MNAIREALFDLLFNAFLQIASFAVVAAAFSPLIAKAKAKYQHLFYLGVLALSLAIPVSNTFWHTRPSVIAERPSQDALHKASSLNGAFWIWKGNSKAQLQFELGAGVESAIVAIWGAFVLYQLIHFGRGVRRVHRLRRDASPLSSAEIGMARSVVTSPRVAFLKSTDIDDPVAVGVLHPAIILPAKLIPALRTHELLAVFAHEYAHVRRGDFFVHILCVVLSSPVAIHPGIRYLMSKISQTRELACDEHAACQLGKGHLYARTLLRLASLCLHAPRGNALELGIFDGDNLEDRIMMLTNKRNPLSPAGLFGLVLAITLTFGSGVVIARATSRQTTSPSSDAAHGFAGTWHWMFQGKSFATMTLARRGSGFTGSVTESRIALNDEGGLSNADPSDDTTPKQIAEATLEGSALHVKVVDGFEFTVTLTDDGHAEIHPGGAPPNMKPILADRAQ
ncbi:M56 family metallopeptidase [Edaphobacter sp. HDX4]|uniref:M56 family metallopeptidase n=1 Tax=Edaphobacter sp. HDX4 TaxID=2794064 RepID=UPI002FE56D60